MSLSLLWLESVILVQAPVLLFRSDILAEPVHILWGPSADTRFHSVCLCVFCFIPLCQQSNGPVRYRQNSHTLSRITTLFATTTLVIERELASSPRVCSIALSIALHHCHCALIDALALTTAQAHCSWFVSLRVFPDSG